MRRNTKTLHRGDGMAREVVIIESDPCDTTGNPGFRALVEMLTEVLANPHLLRHGFDAPKQVTIIPNENGWKIETYADVADTMVGR